MEKIKGKIVKEIVTKPVVDVFADGLIATYQDVRKGVGEIAQENTIRNICFVNSAILEIPDNMRLSLHKDGRIHKVRHPMIAEILDVPWYKKITATIIRMIGGRSRMDTEIRQFFGSNFKGYITLVSNTFSTKTIEHFLSKAEIEGVNLPLKHAKS